MINKKKMIIKKKILNDKYIYINIYKIDYFF